MFQSSSFRRRGCNYAGGTASAAAWSVSILALSREKVRIVSGIRPFLLISRGFIPLCTAHNNFNDVLAFLSFNKKIPSLSQTKLAVVSQSQAVERSQNSF
jgi:hypothetical protein